MNDDNFVTLFPPGHFYSPLPLAKDAMDHLAQTMPPPKSLPGIKLNIAGQMALLTTLASNLETIPAYDKEKLPGLRFHFNQNYLCPKDAFVYFLMILHLTPKRIVEVGCGHSSHIALDSNQLHFDNQIECTFIEPNPDRFLGGLLPGDEDRVRFLRHKVQDLNMDAFLQLEKNDILFIDSSHVSKIGSDVNHIVFNVLSALKSGVYVHFHDIFYPFEYPLHWLQLGRAWNEAYLLRGFL